MSQRLWILGALLALTIWLALDGPTEDAANVSQAVTRPAAAARVATPSGTKDKRITAELALTRLKVRPVLHKGFDAAMVVDLAEKEQPIFHIQNWNPPAPKVIAKVEAPKAPAWPYAYLGKQLTQGQWWVYVTLGDDTRVLQKGLILDRNYRVDKIEPPTMAVTYLPLNEVQTVNIGAFK